MRTQELAPAQDLAEAPVCAQPGGGGIIPTAARACMVPAGAAVEASPWRTLAKAVTIVVAVALILLATLVVASAGASRALASETGSTGGDVTVKTCRGGEQTLNSAEYESLKDHNQVRKEAGLDYLCVSPMLTQVARDHSTDMLQNNYFSHTSPTYGDPYQRMDAHGFTGWQTAGENIAYGSGPQAAPDADFQQLMNSPEHHDNIMRDTFDRIGIGAEFGTFAGYSDVGMYSMDFGGIPGAPHDYPDVVGGGASNNGGSNNGGSGTGSGNSTTSGKSTTQTSPGDGSNQTNTNQQTSKGGSTGSTQTSIVVNGHKVSGGGSGGGSGAPGQVKIDRSAKAAGDVGQSLDKAQQQVCEAFGKTRQQVVGSLMAQASGAKQSDLSARIKARVADEFMKAFKPPDNCGFAPRRLKHEVNKPAGDAGSGKAGQGSANQDAKKESKPNSPSGTQSASASELGDQIRAQVMNGLKGMGQ